MTTFPGTLSPGFTSEQTGDRKSKYTPREIVAEIVGSRIYGSDRQHTYRHTTLPCADEILAALLSHFMPRSNTRIEVEAENAGLVEALRTAEPIVRQVAERLFDPCGIGKQELDKHQIDEAKAALPLLADELAKLKGPAR